MIDAELSEYLEQAKSWESDTVANAKKSERRAWLVAIVAVVIALASVVAVVGLTPLKKVQLAVVKVDKLTGYSEVADSLVNDALTYDDAKDKYWAAQYVEARERYSNEITGTDYIKIGLLSTPDEGSEYAQKMDPNNKASPLNTYGKSGKVSVHIVSVTLLGNGVAQVRYTRTERRGGIDDQPTNWIATVSFRYENLKLSEDERRINAVGFQCTDYRNEPENVQAISAKH